MRSSRSIIQVARSSARSAATIEAAGARTSWSSAADTEIGTVTMPIVVMATVIATPRAGPRSRRSSAK